LFFSNHIFRLSTVWTSFFISEKASINRAWVSMGAWCQYQELVLAFQYIPNSSLRILFSSRDLIILFAVAVSPFLYVIKDRSPFEYKSFFIQYFWAWPI